MNELRLVTCEVCGWVHMGVTLGFAFGESKRFVDWHNEQDWTVDYPDGSPYGEVSYSKLMMQYLHCFRCGAFCTNLREAKVDDCPDGVTIQPIVAHGELVFDTAEMDELRIDNHLLDRAARLIYDLTDGLPQREWDEVVNWLEDYAATDQRRNA